MRTPSDTSKSELQRLLRQANRKHLLNLRTKLFCSACKTTQRVIDMFGNLTCKLPCGHRREIEAGIGARIKKLEREVRDIETSEVGDAE